MRCLLPPTGERTGPCPQSDTVQAVVHPGLSFFRFLSIGLREIMDCMAPVVGGNAESVYFYPPAKFKRGGFTNPTQFDVGIVNTAAGGGRTGVVTFPIGLPINTNMGENEVEIRELLKLGRNP